MKRRAYIWNHVKRGSRCEKILQGIELGLSNETLAKRFGTGPKVIELYRKALKGGFDNSGKRRSWNWHPPAFYAKVNAMAEKGMSKPEIAEKLGVTRNQVYYYLKKYKELKESGEL